MRWVKFRFLLCKELDLINFYQVRCVAIRCESTSLYIIHINWQNSPNEKSPNADADLALQTFSTKHDLPLRTVYLTEAVFSTKTNIV